MKIELTNIDCTVYELNEYFKLPIYIDINPENIVNKLKFEINILPQIRLKGFDVNIEVDKFEMTFTASILNDAEELTSTEKELIKDAGFVNFTKEVKLNNSNCIFSISPANNTKFRFSADIHLATGMVYVYN